MDKGPWKVDVWARSRTVVLQSDDFEHDVALEISGDFSDFDEQIKYANWLADVLTRATVNGGAKHD